jgi:hypothetical protein
MSDSEANGSDRTLKDEGLEVAQRVFHVLTRTKEMELARVTKGLSLTLALLLEKQVIGEDDLDTLLEALVYV